jgi:hypothetical protein
MNSDMSALADSSYHSHRAWSTHTHCDVCFLGRGCINLYFPFTLYVLLLCTAIFRVLIYCVCIWILDIWVAFEIVLELDENG